MAGVNDGARPVDLAAVCNSANKFACSRSHTPACCQSRSRRQAVIPTAEPELLRQVLAADPGVQDKRIP